MHPTESPRARTLDPESIDLADLARQLARVVPPAARAGRVRGRTVFRDATVELLRCSALEAEQLVDTLVARGFLVLEPAAAEAPSTWDVVGEDRPLTRGSKR